MPSYFQGPYKHDFKVSQKTVHVCVNFAKGDRGESLFPVEIIKSMLPCSFSDSKLIFILTIIITSLKQIKALYITEILNMIFQQHPIHAKCW